MSDELDARARSLMAERQRPEKPEPSVNDLLAELIHTLAGLYGEQRKKGNK